MKVSGEKSTKSGVVNRLRPSVAMIHDFILTQPSRDSRTVSSTQFHLHDLDQAVTNGTSRRIVSPGRYRP